MCIQEIHNKKELGSLSDAKDVLADPPLTLIGRRKPSAKLNALMETFHQNARGLALSLFHRQHSFPSHPLTP